MRTMILALAIVLLAAPAWAVVYITATHLGDGVVSIDYNSVGEPNLPRAFALDITVSEGNITDCCDYAVGDDNNGFGIFPGSFGVLYVDPLTGLVETWDVGTYTPVAIPGPDTHPTALGGLGTNGITIEMGSLYDTNAPYDSGRLCTVTVSSNPCTLSVTPNALSGNVVMEDVNDPVGGVNLDGATDVPIGVDCFPSDDPVAYAAWAAFEKPDCWCYANQCYGDADGIKYGDAWTGYYHVGTPDLGLVADGWMVKEPPFASEPYPNGLIDVPNGICADFDHEQYGDAWTGYYRVGTPDLGILANAWMAKEIPFNDPAHQYFPNGMPGDCVPEPVEP